MPLGGCAWRPNSNFKAFLLPWSNIKKALELEPGHREMVRKEAWVGRSSGVRVSNA